MLITTFSDSFSLVMLVWWEYVGIIRSLFKNFSFPMFFISNHNFYLKMSLSIHNFWKSRCPQIFSEIFYHFQLFSQKNEYSFHTQEIPMILLFLLKCHDSLFFFLKIHFTTNRNLDFFVPSILCKKSVKRVLFWEWRSQKRNIQNILMIILHFLTVSYQNPRIRFKLSTVGSKY